MTQLVTLGESMATVTSTCPGPYATGMPMRLSVAGAESNVAVGVSRLGHRAAWIGRVGADSLGTMVLAAMRAEGVDVSHARRDTERPTGLMLRERRLADRIRASYYRAGSAGARLAPHDVDRGLLAGAEILHVTGITPSLSDTAEAAVQKAVEVARSAGVTVSLDINYRSQLWSRARAAEVLVKLLPLTDVVFAGEEEATLFVDGDEPLVLAERLCALGPATAVVKLGSRGCAARVQGAPLRVPAIAARDVDPIGAGDAFVAGCLAGMLERRSAEQWLRLGTVCGAFAVSVPGDWEGLPRRQDLHLLEASDVSR
jgi:2-dehydro-3-deoxygluconokinase